jgi:hypothetical protein
MPFDVHNNNAYLCSLLNREEKLSLSGAGTGTQKLRILTKNKMTDKLPPLRKDPYALAYRYVDYMTENPQQFQEKCNPYYEKLLAN